MKKKIAGVFVAAVIFAFLAAGCGSEVVATVNGENITQQELEEQVDMYKSGLEQRGADFSGDKGKEVIENLRRDVLEQMIEEKLLMQEAREKGLEPSAGEVKDRISSMKESFESEGEFKKVLAANGLSEPLLRDLVEKELIQQKLVEEVTAGIEVQDSEAKEYYQEHQDKYTEPEKRKVRHILVMNQGGDEQSLAESKMKAMELIERINHGADFAKLVAEESDDPSAGENGGLITVARGSGLGKEFTEKAFELEQGEVTQEPVKTMYGFHVIKMEKKIPSRVQPFPEVKEQIKNQLEQERKSNKFDEYMNNLREKSKIINKLTHKNDSSAKK